MNKIQEKNLTRRGRGRPKGSPNKTSAAIKDMVVQALEKSGGVEYLERQAETNPTAFLGLVGKVLPLQVDLEAGPKLAKALTWLPSTK